MQSYPVYDSLDNLTPKFLKDVLYFRFIIPADAIFLTMFI